VDIGERRIWQQAAGDTDRNYVDLCLRWGVILNGPGYLGAWPACREPLRNEGWSSRKLSDLRRFCEEMIDGDLVVLRLGTGVVPAVGVVDGNYVWSDAFGDVDGWDLQHVRRVRWLWIGNEAKSFGTYALKLGDTTQLLNDGVVREWISSLEHNSAGPFPALPVVSESSEISHERISEFLFDEGVASASIRSLMGEIGELTRIAKWYQRAAPPSEHETVAYLVVPLLRALGWTPQRMGVEWYRLDVALFDSLPRGDETLRVVVEAKKMGNSCLSAKSQAAAYAEGRAGCLRLIVTDGIRYGAYIKQKSGEFELYAYLNLARLRDEYPVYGCHGAEEALLAMSPEWRPERTNSRRLRADRLEEV
jgi:hypothetical protein